MILRTFSELSKLKTFEERFDYLNLSGQVGDPTFGYDRIFNQYFYHSKEWRQARNKIILRDNGCDLGVPGYEIHGRIYVHHINPVSLEDVEEMSDRLFDPDNLICVSFDTHNAIHFGTKRTIPKVPIERTPGDTCPWR
jgi:hypothetical protein